MKAIMNCAYPTLFKGKKSEAPEVKTEVKTPVQAQPKVEMKTDAKPEVMPQLQPQLAADKVEISAKVPKAKCEGDACKK